MTKHSWYPPDNAQMTILRPSQYSANILQEPLPRRSLWAYICPGEKRPSPFLYFTIYHLSIYLSIYLGRREPNFAGRAGPVCQVRHRGGDGDQLLQRGELSFLSIDGPWSISLVICCLIPSFYDSFISFIHSQFTLNWHNHELNISWFLFT